MKTLSVGEFKTHFSEALEDVRRGKSIGVSYGRKGSLVAVLVPPKLYLQNGGVMLGALKGKASFQNSSSDAMTDEGIFLL